MLGRLQTSGFRAQGTVVPVHCRSRRWQLSLLGMAAADPLRQHPQYLCALLLELLLAKRFETEL